MFATRQDLLSLKEENLKLKENFKIFLKKHEQNKKYISKEKVKEFMDEQETIINNVNQQIDDIIIVKDENQCKQIAAHIALSRKRKKCEILNIASKKPCMEPKIVKNSLGNFINNPGLQHLAENIFSCLNYKDLESCQLVNRSSVSILANPKFWLTKFIQKGMSSKNHNDWMKAIQLTKDTDLKRNLQLYLKKSLGKEKLVDIPCFIDEIALKKASELMKKFHFLGSFFNSYNNYFKAPRGYQKLNLHKGIELYNVNPGSIQALIATQTSPPDWPMLMRLLARNGNLNMIKVLSPLLSNPDARKFHYDLRPTYFASKYGHLEIVKFLAPLSENDNNHLQIQCASIARILGYHDIVKYLKSIIEFR